MSCVALIKLLLIHFLKPKSPRWSSRDLGKCDLLQSCYRHWSIPLWHSFSLLFHNYLWATRNWLCRTKSARHSFWKAFDWAYFPSLDKELLLQPVSISTEGSKEGTVYLEPEMLVFVSIKEVHILSFSLPSPPPTPSLLILTHTHIFGTPLWRAARTAKQNTCSVGGSYFCRYIWSRFSPQWICLCSLYWFRVLYIPAPLLGVAAHRMFMIILYYVAQ